MNRRDFLIGTVGALTTAYAQFAHAQQMPRVMIFGMSLVEKTRFGDIKVWCPGAAVPAKIPAPAGAIDIPNVHRTFIVGPPDVVIGLSKEENRRETMGSGLSEGHDDLKEYDSNTGLMACLPTGTLQVGSGDADMDDALEVYLPKLRDLAKLCEPSRSFSVRDLESIGETVKLELGSGILGPASKRSKNKGTHGIRWRASYKPQLGPPRLLGDQYYLTDLLEFVSAKSSLALKFGDLKATLPNDKTLWVINVPLYSPNDGTTNVIEHAHAWFDLLEVPLIGKVEFNAIDTTFDREGKKGKFKHPCLPLDRTGADYFPPDTDPCFGVMA